MGGDAVCSQINLDNLVLFLQRFLWDRLSHQTELHQIFRTDLYSWTIWLSFFDHSRDVAMATNLAAESRNQLRTPPSFTALSLSFRNGVSQRHGYVNSSDKPSAFVRNSVNWEIRTSRSFRDQTRVNYVYNNWFSSGQLTEYLKPGMVIGDRKTWHSYSAAMQ